MKAKAEARTTIITSTIGWIFTGATLVVIAIENYWYYVETGEPWIPAVMALSALFVAQTAIWIMVMVTTILVYELRDRGK